MKEMKKKINGFIMTSLISALLLVGLGLVFLLAPGTSLEVIRWIIAIFCLAAGAYLVVSDFRRRVLPFFSTSFVGVILLVLGFLFAVRPSIMNIFPAVIGCWFIVSAIASGRFSAALRGTSSGMFAIITTVLSLVCGILLILNPWEGQVAMVTFAGVMMVIYGVSSLIDTLIIKHNIDDVSKAIKEAVVIKEEKK